MISSKLTVAPYDFREVSLRRRREIRDKREAFLCLYMSVLGYDAGRAKVIVDLAIVQEVYY